MNEWWDHQQPSGIGRQRPRSRNLELSFSCVPHCGGLWDTQSSLSPAAAFGRSLSQEVGNSYRGPKEKQPNEPQPGVDSAGSQESQRWRTCLTGILDLCSLRHSPSLRRRKWWSILRVTSLKVEKTGKLVDSQGSLASDELHYSKQLITGLKGSLGGKLMLRFSLNPRPCKHFAFLLQPH